MSFATLKTGIDGLDGILGGGIRYPDDAAAFVCVAGGPGTGKTLLALETVVRAWLSGEEGTFLYYSVEHTPDSIEKKLAFDFDWFQTAVDVRAEPREVPSKLVLRADQDGEPPRKLVLTQARPAALTEKSARGTTVDIDWATYNPLSIVIFGATGDQIGHVQSASTTRRAAAAENGRGISRIGSGNPRSEIAIGVEAIEADGITAAPG